MQSFKNAHRGIIYALSGRSFLIQTVIGILALTMAVVFPISRIEKIIVAVLVALVLAFEAFNTALELLLDHIAPEHHLEIGRVKDLLAATVLIVSIAALAIGIAIFGRVIVAMLIAYA